MRPAPFAALVLLAALPVSGGGARAQAPTETVPVCESLLALRQLAAAAGEDRAGAAARIASQPGCRLVPRDQIGHVQRRAMFGGGAYECAAIAGGACAWVMP